MSPTRIALYLFIAIVCSVVAYYNLAGEPHSQWSINLIHLLFRH